MSTHGEQAQKQALGAKRLIVARRLLLRDRAHSAWWEAAARAGRGGEYMELNWYARCRVARHRGGILLAEEANWGAFLAELEDWPSLLWAHLMTRNVHLDQAKACYGGNATGKLAMTVRTTEGVAISPAQWVPRNLQRVNQMELLAWCGVVGGALPAIREGIDLQQD